MKDYFIKTPWWLKQVYRSYTWNISTREKIVYPTFDDGPHPEATSFVLDELKRTGAKGTFFCIGKNVVAEPMLYKRILDEGHSVGNHTMNHLNGWKSSDADYLKNVAEAARHIDSSLFRPPYGRIKKFQAANLSSALHKPSPRIIMWDVLSADFDEALSSDDCMQHILKNYRPGSIVVMHDSAKAFPRLKGMLPAVLDHWVAEGYRVEKL